MKYFYFFIISFLFSTPIFSQCTGDIYLETQADVDAFPSDYGCEVIEGFLFIGGDFYNNPSDIHDLSPLTSITEITKGLRIAYTESLENVNGLNNRKFKLVSE